MNIEYRTELFLYATNNNRNKTNFNYLNESPKTSFFFMLPSKGHQIYARHVYLNTVLTKKGKLFVCLLSSIV